MAILLPKNIVNNRATPVNYLKYRLIKDTLQSEGGIMENALHFNNPTDDNDQRIPGRAARVVIDAYTTAEAREAAKKENRTADYMYFFNIYNWEEKIEHTRQPTLEEKKKMIAFDEGEEALEKYTDAEIEKMKFPEVLDHYEKILHPDYDVFVAAINTPDEARIAYECLKNNPANAAFLEGSKDV